MLIHQAHVGAIMGKGGQQIRELIKKTETEMSMYGEVCPESSERVLLINAKKDKVLEAVKEIVNILRLVKYFYCIDSN